MKFTRNTLILATLMSIYMTSVSGVMNCLTNTYTELDQVMVGVSYGLKGTYNTTDCSNTTVQLVKDGVMVIDSLMNVFTNVMQPYYDLSTLMISASNYAVACSFIGQMSQLNVRLQTSSGLGDMLYTMFNYPSEGFFKAQTSNLADN